MTLIYTLCLGIGGTFVLLSALGGLDGADFAADFDAEVDADFEAEVDAEAETAIAPQGNATFDEVDLGTHAGSAPIRRRWSPFLSLRFWTFALCFFGLTGLLVSWVQPDLAGGIVVMIALLMGLLCGTAAAVALRSLSRTSVSSLTRPEDLTGQLGTVEIPFDANSRGKVRLNIRGSTVGFFALTQEQRAFQPGDAVLVVGLENNKLWVVSADALQPQTNHGEK